MARPSPHSSFAPKGKLKSLGRLSSYIRPYVSSLAGVVIALVITSSSVLGIGKGLSYLIDQGFSQHNPALLDKALVVLMVVTLLLAVATYVRFFLITYVGEKVVANIRQDVYSHVIRMSPGFFETTKTGEILSRLTADTVLLQTVVGSSLSIALRNTLLLIGGLGLLIATSVTLTSYVLLIVPAVVVPIVVFGKQVRRFSRASQDKVAELSAYAEQSLNGIKTIQAYVHEDLECGQFNAHVQDAYSVAMQRIRRRALLTAMVISMVFGAIGFVLWAGGHEVLSGELSAGALSSFIFYSVVVAGAVGALGEVVGDLQRAAGATERLFELLNIEPEVKDPETPVDLPAQVQGSVSFKDIIFYYPARPDKASLEQFTLDIAPGEHVALVGPSGAGKTTVFQLLLRFYDPRQGSISIDSVDIGRLRLADLRSLYGYVPQDPVIFSANAFENIRFGKPEASNDEVIEAAKSAEALEFLEKLPQGLDTFLGEKGVRLSGGQRQRIAIARAILKDPKILLLDEATSALDTGSEKLVQAALSTLMQNRTTLVIAHRLSTVLNADKIVVVNHGKIEAIGTHGELMQQGGLYEKLAKMQFESRITG